jgi:hypothetical protein
MSEEQFESGKAPVVIVTCHGDLQVRGWSESALLVKGSGYSCSESEKAWSIESTKDLKLYVPVATDLTIAEVNGDLKVKMVEGGLTISEAMGDVVARNVGAIDLGTIYGDLLIRNVNGMLTIRSIMGDISARNTESLEIGSIHGDCSIRYVNGAAVLNEVLGDISIRTINEGITIGRCRRDLNVKNVGGQLSADDVSGDIRLYGGLPSGKHSLKAQGDIVVRWPVDQPLLVEAHSPEIRRIIELEDLVEETGLLSGRIGEGETFLLLNAKGRIIIKEAAASNKQYDDTMDMDFDMDLDFGGLGEQFASEINNRMSEFSARMEKEFGPSFTAKIERTAKEAANKAERAADRAIRKAEKAARKARYQADRTSWNAPPPPARAQSPKENKATEEEQIKILRMVENGIISPDEASTLLEAIDS